MGIITLENVTKVYKTEFLKKNVVAVKNLTLEIQKGEVFGFIGPNGAGKTTTIKLLTGLIKPTSGTIMINGISSSKNESRNLIGFLPESPQFYEYLTGYEYLAMISSLIPKQTIGKNEINETLERVGLIRSKDVKIRKYSRGMGQRLGIAQAIIGNPEILILDEPLSGLDPFGRQDVERIINDLKKDLKTIFFSSHIISDVEKMANRVAIIKNGTIICDGPLKDLTKEVSLEEFFVNEAN